MKTTIKIRGEQPLLGTGLRDKNGEEIKEGDVIVCQKHIEVIGNVYDNPKLLRKAAMRILYLPLKKEWYNAIESGKKTEEYRAIKPYWVSRFCKEFPRSTDCYNICGYACMIGECFKPTQEYTHVCFRYGYTKRTMTFKIDSISIGKGKPEMGAPNCNVFIIKFSKEDGQFK